MDSDGHGRTGDAEGAGPVTAYVSPNLRVSRPGSCSRLGVLVAALQRLADSEGRLGDKALASVGGPNLHRLGQGRVCSSSGHAQAAFRAPLCRRSLQEQDHGMAPLN